MSYILQSKTSGCFLVPSRDLRGYLELVDSKWSVNEETGQVTCRAWQFPTFQAAGAVMNAINGMKHLNLVPVLFGEARVMERPVLVHDEEESFGTLLSEVLVAA